MIELSDLFKGTWRFERTVKNLSPEPLNFEGNAHFIEKNPYTLYEESGSYILKDQHIDFATSYLYQFVEKNHYRILFPDQRLFYELTQPSQNMEHPCAQDYYKGHFDSLSPDHWKLNWHINGPRKKNVQIMTCYFRT